MLQLIVTFLSWKVLSSLKNNITKIKISLVNTKEML